MEALYEKTAIVVQKTETLDPDDRISIEYEIMFVINDEDSKEHSTSFVMSTDDKELVNKFSVGKKTDLKFLEPDDKQLKAVTKIKAN